MVLVAKKRRVIKAFSGFTFENIIKVPYSRIQPNYIRLLWKSIDSTATQQQF